MSNGKGGRAAKKVSGVLIPTQGTIKQFFSTQIYTDFFVERQLCMSDDIMIIFWAFGTYQFLAHMIQVRNQRTCVIQEPNQSSFFQRRFATSSFQQHFASILSPFFSSILSSVYSQSSSILMTALLLCQHCNYFCSILQVLFYQTLFSIIFISRVLSAAYQQHFASSIMLEFYQHNFHQEQFSSRFSSDIIL